MAELGGRGGTVSTMPLPAQTKYGTKRDRSAYSGIMAESSESHLVAPPTPAAKKQRAGRVTAAVVLSGCLAAVAGSFMAGRHGTRDALVGRTPLAFANMEGGSQQPPGYVNPNDYLAQQAHVRFVRSTAEAQDMAAANGGTGVRLSVPCSWGVHCQLHVRPTLREHTGGAWLGEGKVSALHSVSTARYAGPWLSKVASGIPAPANSGGWGFDRAAGKPAPGRAQAARRDVDQFDHRKIAPSSPYFKGARDDKQLAAAHAPVAHKAASHQEAKDVKQEQAEKAKEARLKRQEAAIQARMGKILDSYGEAAIATTQGYKR